MLDQNIANDSVSVDRSKYCIYLGLDLASFPPLLLHRGFRIFCCVKQAVKCGPRLLRYRKTFLGIIGEFGIVSLNCSLPASDE